MKRILKKNFNREFRKKGVRAKIFGTTERPRLSIFRSNKYLTIQLINDEKGATLISGSTKGSVKDNKTNQASALGKMIAEKIKKMGIKNVIFDRGFYQYHGRIKALAENFLKNLK